MKTRKIRLLSALLALAMLLALLPTAAFADDAPGENCGKDGSDVKWSFDTTTGTLTISGKGEMADYVDDFSTFKSTAPWANEQVTRVVINEGVTRIGNKAFFALPSITSVSLPDGVKSIGEYAFSGWSLGGDPAPKIEKIKIPASVTDIEDVAFGGCEKLKTISFEADSKLAKIGVGAFCNCSELYEVTIPASVTTIGRQAFARCSDLQSVTFAPGSKLETIGENAFSDCSKLQTISCESALKEKLSGMVGETKVKIIVTHWNVNFVTDAKTTTTPVENNKKIVDKPADPTREGWDFAGWYTKDESGKWAAEPFDFDTPITNDMTLYARWTASGKCGVGGNDLTWTLDDSGTLTISGSGAMADYEEPENQPWKSQRNSIRKVVIGDKVTSIGENAFANCPGLKAVELPPNGVLETIKYNAFSWVGSSSEVSAGITEITIPKSVITIEKYAFDGCTKLATVTFAPNSKLETIGRMTFQGTAISEISIPASVKTIGNSVFNKCLNLTKVIFESPSSLENVSSNTFVGCSNATIYYSDETAKNVLSKVVSPDRIKLLTPTVTFVSNGGSNVEPATVKNGEKISAPAVPTREGWNFAGWYTKDESGKWAAKPFDFDTPIMDNMTLYARWETKLVDITPAVELYPITIDYGTAYDAEGNPIEKAAAGDVVTIKADETALEGMTFERWEVRKGEVKLENDRAAETTFTMPAGEVQLEAMYQAADANDSGWDAATVVTGAVIGTGTAILAYHIGMEVYAEQVLGKDVAVPRTRSEVALLAWQLAGSPAVNVEGEPLSEVAQAEKWAVESGLMEPDAEGNFNSTKKMSKLKALRVLDAAKKMG